MKTLDEVRKLLESLEDNIIFSLLERFRYSFNKEYYDGKLFRSYFSDFENVLKKTEFFNDFDRQLFTEPDLYSCNEKILKYYLNELLEKNCSEATEDNLAVFNKDIHILQLISRRIYSGVFVAVSKYESNKSGYEGLIKKQNVDGIMTLLTDRAAEERVLDRVLSKTDSYASILYKAPGNYGEVLRSTYENFIIPLTKDVEVYYLLSLKDRFYS